jgi:hypothetical protein
MRDKTERHDVGSATDARPARAPAGRARPTVTPVVTRSAHHLARSWGRAWASWSAPRLAEQLALLSRSASPRLAAELREALSLTHSTAPDHTGSRGAVEVTHVGPGNAARQLIVVTREVSYGPAGPDPAGPRYRVYVGVAVRERAGGWKMSQWTRQP